MEIIKVDRAALKDVIRELLIEDSKIFKDIIEEIFRENQIIVSDEQLERRKRIETMIQEDFDKYEEVFKKLA